MKDTGDPVRDALDRIEALNLPHPTGPLLSAFVTQALNPLAAADYVEKRLDATDADTIINDWTFIVESVTKTSILPQPPDTESQQRIRQRDGDKCCITGRQGTESDPLITTAILPIPKNWANSDSSNVANMLGAFFGPAYRDWWLSYIKNPSSIASLQNHWLVSKSAALSFSRGLLRLDRYGSSMIDFEVSNTRISPDLGRGGDDNFVSLRDHSRCGYQVVDARFVGTHARLSPSIQCINLAQQFAKQQTTSHPKPWPVRWLIACQRAAALTFFLPAKLLSNVAWTVWRILPQGLRLSTYFRMSQLQTAFFGRATYGTSVVKLPFGLFLKQYPTAELCRNEFATLQMVRKCSTIPVPKPLDMIIINPDVAEIVALKPDSYEAPSLGRKDVLSLPGQQSPPPEQESPLVEIPPFEPQSISLQHEPQLDVIPPFDPSSLPNEPELHDTAPSQIFVVMSGLPGSSLDQSIESISDPDLACVCEDLKGCLRQLQTIKNTVNAEFPICSTLGEGILDHRLNGSTPSGPFTDEASFNQLLAYPDDPAFQGHKIVYTHADLNPRNILVDRFRQDDGSVRWGISGIIDWETAGFFPEYWEYTKSRYEAFRWSKRLADFLENSIGASGNYTDELEAELRNWQRQIALG